MKIIEYPDKSQWKEILKRPSLNAVDLTETIRGILDKIRDGGDKAVLECEVMFDRVQLDCLSVSEKELKEAEELLSDDLKQAILSAKKNIEKFHAAQRFEGKKVETTSGVTCWQKAVAIEKVGLHQYF